MALAILRRVGAKSLPVSRDKKTLAAIFFQNSMASTLNASHVCVVSLLSISSQGSKRGISSYVGLHRPESFMARAAPPLLRRWGPRQEPRRGARQLSVCAATAEMQEQMYVVQKGDSLWGIAMKHDLTVEKLKALNPSLDSTTGIDVGQRIVVGSAKKVEVPKAAKASAAAAPEPVKAVAAAASQEAKAERKQVPVAAKAERKAATSGIVKRSPPPVPAKGGPVTLSPTVVGLGIAIAGAIAFSSSLSVRGSKSPSPSSLPPQGTTDPLTSPAHASTNGSALTAVQKPIKRAAPAALAAIAESFPNAMEQESFIGACARELFNLGFRKDNCIALVNTCRDEVCRPLVDLIDREFGLSFNLAGLGGLVNSGITGMKAGMSHSPVFPCDESGKPRERYIFFAFPHISIGESGEAGSLLRRGRGRPSSACGALIAVRNEVKTYVDESNKPYPADDFEYHSLKRKVLAQPVCQRCGPDGPSLVQVTKAAQEVITEDLEDLISKTVDPSIADYAVITGVQIHSGCQVPGEPFRLDRTVDYIAPSTMYAVIRGERYMMHCEVNQINLIRSIKPQMATV